jgi:lipoprotein-anchoring transpeptidase ErfK/SrfK
MARYVPGRAKAYRDVDVGGIMAGKSGVANGGDAEAGSGARRVARMFPPARAACARFAAATLMTLGFTLLPGASVAGAAMLAPVSAHAIASIEVISSEASAASGAAPAEAIADPGDARAVAGVAMDEAAAAADKPTAEAASAERQEPAPGVDTRAEAAGTAETLPGENAPSASVRVSALPEPAAEDNTAATGAAGPSEEVATAVTTALCDSEVVRCEPAREPVPGARTETAYYSDPYESAEPEIPIDRAADEAAARLGTSLRPRSPLVLRKFNEGHPSRSILIRTSERRLLYFVDANTALEFPVGIARSKRLQRIGATHIAMKRRDPTWVPTGLQHRVYRRLPHAMGPGPKNPLGTRALNLTIPMIRIHGTNDDAYIGAAKSDGCFRMYNRDIEFLFEVVSVGTKVVIVR